MNNKLSKDEPTFNADDIDQQEQQTCQMAKRKKWQKPIAWVVVMVSIILLVAIIVSEREQSRFNDVNREQSAYL